MVGLNFDGIIYTSKHYFMFDSEQAENVFRDLFKIIISDLYGF